jgi:hypothetical protein
MKTTTFFSVLIIAIGFATTSRPISIANITFISQAEAQIRQTPWSGYEMAGTRGVRAR